MLAILLAAGWLAVRLLLIAFFLLSACVLTAVRLLSDCFLCACFADGFACFVLMAWWLPSWLAGCTGNHLCKYQSHNQTQQQHVLHTAWDADKLPELSRLV